MPIGGKEAFLSKVTFRRESNWVSKTKHMLKGMETIEGRAKAYHNRIIEQNEQAEAWDFYNAYRIGATEQKAIDIEKACEWLERYMESLGYIDEWCRKGENEFIKAIGEE